MIRMLKTCLPLVAATLAVGLPALGAIAVPPMSGKPSPFTDSCFSQNGNGVDMNCTWSIRYWIVPFPVNSTSSTSVAPTWGSAYDNNSGCYNTYVCGQTYSYYSTGGVYGWTSVDCNMTGGGASLTVPAGGSALTLFKFYRETGCYTGLRSFQY